MLRSELQAELQAMRDKKLKVFHILPVSIDSVAIVFEPLKIRKKG